MSRIIQDKIDEYKEQLPDQLYIELCALTMKENKKEDIFILYGNSNN